MSMSKLRDAEDPLLIPESAESKTSEGEDSTDDMSPGIVLVETYYVMIKYS